MWSPVPASQTGDCKSTEKRICTCVLVADDDPLKVSKEARPVVEVPRHGGRDGVVREQVHLVSQWCLAFSPEVGVKTTGDWVKYPYGPIGLLDVSEVVTREGGVVQREAREACLEVNIPLGVAAPPPQQAGEAPPVCRPVGAAAQQYDGPSLSDIPSLELCLGQVTPEESSKLGSSFISILDMYRNDLYIKVDIPYSFHTVVNSF